MTLARRLRIWRQRLRSLARSRELDAELDGELAFHFDQLVAEKLADGLSPDEARRAARLEFGNVAVITEASRDQRAVTWIHDIGRDAAYGMRMLRKSPVFTAVAIVSLALGIGTNAAVVTAIDTVLFRGLGLPHADRLAFIRTVSTDAGGQASGVSGNEFLAWLEGSRAFDLLAATLSSAQDCAADRYGPAEHLRGQGVTSGLFATLGAAPLLGRVFDPAESRLVDPLPAIVISERLWRRRYGSDPGIIGATIRIGGNARTVVGVMPQEFRFESVLIDFWIPLRLLREPAGSSGRPLRVFARLKPGVTLAQAQADLDSMGAGLASRFPGLQRGWRAEIQSLDEALYGWARQPLLRLQIAVALVLLIACANVAGLLLARGSARQREMCLRAALGAGRRRIVRQLLTESLLLSLAGGLLGIVVAWFGLRGLSAMTPALASPPIGRIPLDLRLLAATIGLSILSAAFFGTLPALIASRVEPIEMIRASGAERATARPRATHVVAVAVQFALALALMIGAGLLVKSAYRLAGREFHFVADHVMMFDLALPVPQRPFGTYRGAPYYDIVQPMAPTYARVLERLRALGGVESAGGSSYPLVNSLVLPSVTVILREAAPPAVDRSMDDVTHYLVTPGLFMTLRTPVLAGRQIDEGDGRDAPWVAMVNESAARRFWPGGDPIGRQLLLDTVPDEQVRRVVGVVPDIPLRHGELVSRPVVYTSYLQQPSRTRAPWRTLSGSMTFVVRTSGDPDAILPPVRRTVADIVPDHAIANAGTVGQHLDAAMQQFRHFTFLVTVLACTAGALAVIGIYGTVAYSAGRRVREIGIRKALGANPWQIGALVAQGAVRMMAAGLAFGIAGALVLTRLFASELWNVGPTDPATYVTAAFILVAVAAAACVVPARRAIAADPAAAIRCE